MSQLAKLKETIESLEEALASGVLTVVVDGETTVFDSEEGLRKRLGYFQNKLSRLRTGQSHRPAFGSISLGQPRPCPGST